MIYPTSVSQNDALGNTSSIEEAEYELIELETENRVSLFISWSMILFCSYAVSLFIRQVWTGPHITFSTFHFH